jgi:hypothetical protein
MPIGFLERWQRKKKQRLFKQWVDKAELPPEEIPPDLLNEHPETETGMGTGDMPSGGGNIYTTLDSGTVRLPFRYVIIGLSIIAFLLILSTVLLTILIMR